MASLSPDGMLQAPRSRYWALPSLSQVLGARKYSLVGAVSHLVDRLGGCRIAVNCGCQCAPAYIYLS